MTLHSRNRDDKALDDAALDLIRRLPLPPLHLVFPH